jgi:hypothetical protein
LPSTSLQLGDAHVDDPMNFPIIPVVTNALVDIENNATSRNYAKIHSDSAENSTSTSVENPETGTDPEADNALDHASANPEADSGAPAASQQTSARPRAASLSHRATSPAARGKSQSQGRFSCPPRQFWCRRHSRHATLLVSVTDTVPSADPPAQ